MTVYPDPNRCPPCTIITKEGYSIIGIGDWPGFRHAWGSIEQWLEENRELINKLAEDNQ